MSVATGLPVATTCKYVPISLATREMVFAKTLFIP